MALPISSVVNVNIAVSPAFQTQDGFGNLLLLTDGTGIIGEPINQITRYKEYATILEVGTDWATTSEVYKMANTFFSQQPSPVKCSVGLRLPLGITALLKGDTVVDSLTTVYTITDGSFNITMSGETKDITGLDFAGASATVEADIATVVQAGLQAASTGAGDPWFQATCVWTGSSFEIKNGLTGATSTISFVSASETGTYLGELLYLEYGRAQKGNGVDVETVQQSLVNISQKNNGYFGIALPFDLREFKDVNGEVAITGAAAFAEANDKLLFVTTNSDNAITANTNDILSSLNLAGYSNTFCIYSTTREEYPCCSVAGRLFTVDYTPGNSAITLMFKQLPTITQENLTSSEANYLFDKGGNVFDTIGGNAMLATGQQVNKRFTDEVHALAWLKSEIENEVFGVMYLSASKIPFTNGGVAILAQAMRGALERAFLGDVLGSGSLSDGTLVTNGYLIETLPVSQVPLADKEQRLYNYLSFKALGSGAIHGVTINGTFER